MTVTTTLCTKVSLSFKLIPFVSTFAITLSILTIDCPTRGPSRNRAETQLVIPRRFSAKR